MLPVVCIELEKSFVNRLFVTIYIIAILPSADYLRITRRLVYMYSNVICFAFICIALFVKTSGVCVLSGP